MPVESSLEVYKIILGGQTFSEIIRKKNSIPINKKQQIIIYKNIVCVYF